MARVRKRNVNIGFHPRTYQRLSELADKLETTINDLVRECVENDLPKLPERYRKRKIRGTSF